MANPYETLSDEELAAMLNRQQSGVAIPGNPASNISVRQNNPGNIKYAGLPGQLGAGTRGFAVYESPEAGFNGIQDLVERYKSKGNHTLASFAHKYAPAFENDTNNWINVVGRFTGAGPDTPLSNIPTYDLARGIAYIESSTNIPGSGGNINPFQKMSDEELAAELNQISPRFNPAQIPGAPQPNKIQSIPDLVAGAIGQQGITPGEGMADIGQMPKPSLGATPGYDPTSESLGMFSPQQAIEGTKIAGQIASQPGGPAHLPTLGMMIGGGLGGIYGGGLGAIPGAALGAGAGRAAELFIKGQKGEELSSIPGQAFDVGKSMATGATAEMGGQVGGKLLEGAFAPGKKWLEKQLISVAENRAAQDLVNQGVPVSPDIIAPSKIAKTVTWIAEKFQPGKGIVQSYREQTANMLMEMRRNAVENLGLPPVGAMPLGATRKEMELAYSKFKDSVGPDAVIPIPNAKNYIDNIVLPDKVTKGDLDTVALLKTRLETGELTAKEIESVAKVWPKDRAYGKLDAASKGWREDFLKNLYKDLDAVETLNGIKMVELLKGAKATSRELFQANYVEGLLDRATDNKNMMFNPQQFYDLVKKNESRILSKLDRDKAENLFRFAEKMKAVSLDFTRLMKGKEQPQWWEQTIASGPAMGLAGGAGTSMYAGSPLLAAAMAIPIGFQGFVARSLMKPNGAVRTWLTKGYKPPTLPVKIGIMEKNKND